MMGNDIHLVGSLDKPMRLQEGENLYARHYVESSALILVRFSKSDGVSLGLLIGKHMQAP